MTKRISACIQVGAPYIVGKPIRLGSGILNAPIYGTVKPHWGLRPNPGATWLVEYARADNGDIDTLTIDAASKIERLSRVDARGNPCDLLLCCETVAEYKAAYANV